MYIEVYKLVSQVQTFTLRVTAKEDLFIYLIGDFTPYSSQPKPACYLTGNPIPVVRCALECQLLRFQMRHVQVLF